MLASYATVTLVLSILKRTAESDPTLKSLLPVIAAVIFLFIPVAAIRAGREKTRDFGITTGHARRDLLFVLICSLTIFPVFFAGNHLYQTILFHKSLHWHIPAGLAEIALTHLLLVAIPEEVFYRGYVQTTLGFSLPSGKSILWTAGWPSILTTSFMFALGHFAMDFNPARLAVFFPSILFGWMREKSGSVTPPALMHAACNVLMAVLEKSYL